MENMKAEMLLADYAAALNAGNVDLIPAFYTADAVFMPDNTRKLTKAELLKNGQIFLNRNRFHISYSIQDITIKDEYAFVQATAQANTVNPVSNQEVNKTSQDFLFCVKSNKSGKYSATCLIM